MPSGRLMFLYPPLTRGVMMRTGRGIARRQQQQKQQSTFAKRHGKAVEPLALRTAKDVPRPLESVAEEMGMAVDEIPEELVETKTDAGNADSLEKQTTSASASANTSKMQGHQHKVDDATVVAAAATAGAAATAVDGGIEDGGGAKMEQAVQQPQEKQRTEQEVGKEAEEQRAKSLKEEAKQGGPLEAVLHLSAPKGRMHSSGPSMSPPPYVHHFDSYSLVKQLQLGGYSQGQATTAMKGIRTALARNLNIAQSSLVSKSDVENESYLFTAACSELSTEIKNNRRLQDEQIRQQRTHLQHEVDILAQSLNQELHTLNDNVRGMFNDRKMAVREEQKAAESAVQQISYKISIMLSSDAKSEIEGVRWILIRRSVVGILFMAVLTLGTLRYATYVSHERQREAERKKKEEEERRRDGGKRDHSLAADAAVILAAN